MQAATPAPRTARHRRSRDSYVPSLTDPALAERCPPKRSTCGGEEARGVRKLSIEWRLLANGRSGDVFADCGRMFERVSTAAAGEDDRAPGLTWTEQELSVGRHGDHAHRARCGIRVDPLQVSGDGLSSDAKVVLVHRTINRVGVGGSPIAEIVRSTDLHQEPVDLTVAPERPAIVHVADKDRELVQCKAADPPG